MLRLKFFSCGCDKNSFAIIGKPLCLFDRSSKNQRINPLYKQGMYRVITQSRLLFRFSGDFGEQRNALLRTKAESALSKFSFLKFDQRLRMKRFISRAQAIKPVA